MKVLYHPLPLSRLLAKNEMTAGRLFELVACYVGMMPFGLLGLFILMEDGPVIGGIVSLLVATCWVCIACVLVLGYSGVRVYRYPYLLACAAGLWGGYAFFIA